MVKVSIIMPVYNVDKYLFKSLSSVLTQTFSDFELIIINDGSTDMSLSILLEAAHKDSRIKVVDQINQGVSAARNTGLSLAKGQYVYFFDADDYMERELLEKVVAIADEYESNLVIFGYKMIKNDQLFKVCSVKERAFEIENQHFIAHFTKYTEIIDMNSLWNKLYKRDFILKYNLSFSDRKIGEDAFFNYELYAVLDKVVFYEEPLYNYVIHRSGSAMSKFQGEQKIKDKIDVMKMRQTFLRERQLRLLNEQTYYTNIIFAEALILVKENSDKSKYKMLADFFSLPYISELLSTIRFSQLDSIKDKAKLLFCKQRIIWKLINLF
ncbi:glycosyltransferase family 2 protein [Enterococcus wangshanyuanii]|uniref:Glycosyl transferase n=1 Tax=Enterococcus wangshanyuanii TaxID=2005703 RepID=A0ABQ1PQE0_9ENTE|nr:glycosyltransferase [Enterococcus wangshanyuanii]GGD01195.1 glycosyl transferase [Enterococcus wangshanyuanii]